MSEEPYFSWRVFFFALFLGMVVFTGLSAIAVLTWRRTQTRSWREAWHVVVGHRLDSTDE